MCCPPCCRASPVLTSGQTKGPSLEQVALLFDGKDANIGRVNPVAEEFMDSNEKEVEAHGGRVEQEQVEDVQAKSD